MAAAHTEGSPAGPKRKGRARLRPYAVVLGLLLVLLAAGAGYLQYRTQDRLDDTEARLATITDQRDSKAAALEESRQEADALRARLESRKAALAKTRSRLEAKQKRLDSIGGSLHQVQKRVRLQAGQIDTFKTCIDGVIRATHFAEAGAYHTAASILHSVALSCGNARDLL